MTKGWPGLLALAILLAPPPQSLAQDVWRKVDDDGGIRYADRPFPGAAPMQPPETSRWRAPAGSGSDNVSAKEGPQSAAEASAAVSAAAVEIAQPVADETVWGVGGALEVRLILDGERPEGARLSLRLNGAEASWEGEPPVLRLREVWRGEHRLKARLMGAEGQVLAASEEIRFFKREPTISPAQAP